MTLPYKQKRNLPEPRTYTGIPTYDVGPLIINGENVKGVVERVPLATLETTIIPSTQRGMKVIELSGGVYTSVEDRGMTRSPYLRFDNGKKAGKFCEYVKENNRELAAAVESTTKYGKFMSISTYRLGNIVHLRLTMNTGDASGHNMVGKAAEYGVLGYLKEKDLGILDYCLSGNTCTDKKVSAGNMIQGRGKKVDAEIVIPRDIVREFLKTEPEKITRVIKHKNLEGSIIAASIGSANAHHSNIIAAMYLATGQDIANLVEASQGITNAEVRENGDLYFRITSPNLIVGTLGNGKEEGEQRKNLELLGCHGSVDPIGHNSKKLAEIIGATVLAGELSLIAALTVEGALTDAHERYERKKLI